MRPWLFCIGFLWSAAALSALPEIQEPPFVSARLEKSVVEFGSSVIVNCSTSCDHPTDAGLESSLEKEVVGNGSRWRAFRILNISDWDPTFLCYFECPDSDMEPLHVHVTVYRPPKLVVLDPVPVIEVGESYTLTCRVSSVAPIQNLSVTFLKGGKELHTQTFGNHTAREADDIVVNHTLTAKQAVYGEDISCGAVLDLGPEGPVFAKASFHQTLNIMDYMGIIVAIASIAMLGTILVATGIYSCFARKQ